MAGNSIKFEGVKLWHNEYGQGNEIYHSYSVGVSSKKKDSNEYYNTYLPVFFMKNTPVIHNGSTVNLDGFLTCRVKKDGTKYIGMQVMKYEVLFDKDAGTDEDFGSTGGEFDSFEQAERDLPFACVDDQDDIIPF